MQERIVGCFVLSAMLSACTPLAVGSVVVGGSGVVLGAATAASCRGSMGCATSGAVGGIFFMLGLPLLLGGGIALAR